MIHLFSQPAVLTAFLKTLMIKDSVRFPGISSSPKRGLVVRF